MAEAPDYYVKSAEKTLAVLLAFDAAHRELSVTQVAEAINVSRAAARRFLLTLVDLGYLEVEGSTYRQTPRVLDVGASYLSGLTLPQIARPHLQALATALSETTALCVLDGQDILYVERISAPRLHSMNVSIGNRLPAWATSMGRVLVAELAEDAREVFLRNAKLTHFTSKTVAGIDELRTELETVRAQGWSLVAQELDEGLRGLAVPVYRDKQLLGALNVSVQPGRIGSTSITQEILPMMRQVAQDIADDFGGRTAARN